MFADVMSDKEKREQRTRGLAKHAKISLEEARRVDDVALLIATDAYQIINSEFEKLPELPNDLRPLMMMETLTMVMVSAQHAMQNLALRELAKNLGLDPDKTAFIEIPEDDNEGDEDNG